MRIERRTVTRPDIAGESLNAWDRCGPGEPAAITEQRSCRRAYNLDGYGRLPTSTRDGSHFCFQHSPTRAAQSSKRSEVATWRFSQ